MPGPSKDLSQLPEKYEVEGLDTSGIHDDLAARIAGNRNRHTKMLTPQGPEGTSSIRRSPQEFEHGAEASNKPTAAIVSRAQLAGNDSFVRRMVNLNRSLAEIDIEQANLKYLLDNLASSMPGYSGQRHCFLSTFKRDKLRCATPEDLRMIEEYRLVAHGGDARSDAKLYGGPGGRTDVETFEKLYGILPETVEKIKCTMTIAALGTHAGAISSNRKTGSDKFYQLFWKFVRLLDASGTGYQEVYLDNRPVHQVKAYHAFMSCIKTEVTTVAI